MSYSRFLTNFRNFLDEHIRASQVFEGGEKKLEPKDAEIAELERTLGRMTMQLEVAKKVLGQSNFPPKENGEWHKLW